ncbi:MAG: cysteine synthase family protein [Acidobacteria bacterium]|nr:cysteine synthase family protein [Acidobacteriota bacterium]
MNGIVTRGVRPSVLDTIGNTPVIRLRRLRPPDGAEVLLKLEYFSPTGSYKDRMALAMIEQAEARGALQPGMRVVEYTGGSTGSSLAMVCAIKGYKFTAVSSDAWAPETLDTMRAFGATVIVLPSEGGKITAELIAKIRAETERLARSDETYHTNQFLNADALAGYMEIGEELLQQTSGAIDAFCGGVGTAGMLMGVARALRAGGCQARIVALEPASSPLLTAGTLGPHRVEGIGMGFLPPHLNREFYDEARAIEEHDARQMARRLAREEGIFAGTSTGLNVVAALQLARELGPGRTVVTIAVDTGLKYLAGNLFGDRSSRST